ncbi:hypothetical protein O181_098302 [Austropuccinia psidii MF-1]|uniref:Uncharacterized protein n=1 Tax=Austropuccinia psidii MF-1 TaxID=1389203 RepID=A0A9Q3JAZ1_9BASI|nr:hypothetical protein [Austropuccinia psidii MF-1]
MEKNYIMLSTEEWRKTNPTPPRKVPKVTPGACSSNFNMRKEPKSQLMAKAKHQPQTIQPGLYNATDSTGFHGKFVLNGHNHNGTKNKGGIQIKRSEVISGILSSLPNLYIAINDMKKILVTERFNTLFTKSANRWYIKLRHANGHQTWTWWKAQIFNEWDNEAWRFKVKTAFEYAKFNADKDKALPWFCQQKDRLTALYPDMPKFLNQSRILIQCGGDLEHADKSSPTEKSSEEELVNILQEVSTRTRNGSSRVNLKTSFNTPWNDSLDKNPK